MSIIGQWSFALGCGDPPRRNMRRLERLGSRRPELPAGRGWHTAFSPHLSERHHRLRRSIGGRLVDGLAEQPIEDLDLSDISISMAPDSPASFPEMADGLEPLQRSGHLLHNLRGLRLHNVEVSGQLGPGEPCGPTPRHPQGRNGREGET